MQNSALYRKLLGAPKPIAAIILLSTQGLPADESVTAPDQGGPGRPGKSRPLTFEELERVKRLADRVSGTQTTPAVDRRGGKRLKPVPKARHKQKPQPQGQG